MARVITYDIETALNPKDLDGGFAAARAGDAGISVVCLYDTGADAPFTYLLQHYNGKGLERDQEQIELCLSHLQQADWLVSYNGRTFDRPAIEAFTETALVPTEYDVLEEIWRALNWKRQKGYGLGLVAERTLNHGKLDSPAPPWELLKHGRYADLINYCMVDVFRTRQLANFVNEHGYIIDIDGDRLELEPLGDPA